ncbi:GrpB family protein [Enterococcus sp. LJL128]
MSRKIEVVPYNPAWPHLFEEEKACLKQALPDELVVSVVHIGSTSVPGLAAKPIIDICLIVEDIAELDKYQEVMAEIGYESWGAYGLPGRRYFPKGGDQRSHHIHAYQFDNLSEIGRHIAFRDFLRNHREIASTYGEIKQTAAAAYPEDIESYGDYKDEFVKKVEKEALKWLWLNK